MESNLGEFSEFFLRFIRIFLLPEDCHGFSRAGEEKGKQDVNEWVGGEAKEKKVID